MVQTRGDMPLPILGCKGEQCCGDHDDDMRDWTFMLSTPCQSDCLCCYSIDEQITLPPSCTFTCRKDPRKSLSTHFPIILLENGRRRTICPTHRTVLSMIFITPP